MQEIQRTTPSLLKSAVPNIVVGLAVSFVAISLGASLGILSGRGAFAGMISAGIIAIITSVLGGTRIQCSGPTAPMSAITAVVVAFSVSEYDAALSQDQFITLVFLLMALLLIVAGVLRLGRFITLIPNVVISGFMSGIALLIWIGQTNVLFGLNGKEALDGDLLWNVVLVVVTVAVIFATPVFLKKISPKLTLYFPGTLVAIILVSVVAQVLNLPVEYTSLNSDIASFSDFSRVISAQIPLGFTTSDLMLALPFAFQLAMLCYLDTLLTSLVIDRMTNEATKQNKELVAQGVANGFASLVGGIPGAQATIRSVLMIKENATMRLAGICVGVFVMIELILLKDLFSYIPASVFCGILFKVGYDVFDWQPWKIYASQFIGKAQQAAGRVTHEEMGFVFGTILITCLFDLNTAVIGFTLLFFGLNRTLLKNRPVVDLIAVQQTEGVIDER